MFKHFFCFLFCLPILLQARPAFADKQNLNFPSGASVKITREVNGESFIYVEFKWSEDCPPQFSKDQAVEFEVIITPKCFVRPKYGRDDNSNCTNVMGPDGFNLPNSYVDFLNPEDLNKTNCYMDVWNYWVPQKDEIAGLVAQRCGELDALGAKCYSEGSVGAADKNGNFTVGLHDASKLKAGERYFFRYPVEINDDPACLDFPTPTSEEPRTCEDTNHVVHNEWGRAYIAMEVFNNKCDLNCDFFWDWHAYTCPEVIGIVTTSGIGCGSADKTMGYWINRLCVPTDAYSFLGVLHLKRM